MLWQEIAQRIAMAVGSISHLIFCNETASREMISVQSYTNYCRKGEGSIAIFSLKAQPIVGKTFLLNPLTIIYKTFLNPASTTLAWVGTESAEIIFVNDFRWSAQVLPWQDLLLLLEGQPVHFSAHPDALCTGHSIREGHSHFLHVQK